MDDAPQAPEPDRERRALELFDELLPLDEPGRRDVLDRRCASDSRLREEVLGLLEAHGPAEGLFAHGLEAQTFEPAVEPAPPTRVGPYRLVRLLGRGGMGSVYLAERDDAFRKQAAVKLLGYGLDAPEFVARFQAERQILASLEHPGIARLLDGGAVEGRPYLVMEFVGGQPLDRYCAARDLDVRARVALFRQVCAVVHFAHQNLVVHRDLKPGNVLVTPAGEVKLLDFGIAKLLGGAGPETALETLAGHRPMTLAYASPEQIRGERVTTATDVYSLGVVLYELLTGRRPHATTAHDPLELRRAICEAPAVPPSSVPETRPLASELDNVVLKALHKEPERRYASVEQLSEDLGRYLRGWPVLARPDTLAYRVRKFVGRNRLGVAAASLALCALVAFTATLLVQRREILHQTRRASSVSGFMVRLFQQSEPSQARGESVAARQVLDAGAERIGRELAHDPEAQADLLQPMARSYEGLGLYEQARQLYERSLQLRQSSTGPRSAEVASDQQSLAEVLFLEGKYEAAAALTRQALATRLELLGPEHGEVAESRLRLARTLELQGDLPGALAELRQAAATARRAGEPDRLAAVLRRLGNLLGDLQQPEEARATLEEALHLLRQEHSDLNAEVALALNDLGRLEGLAGRWERALARHAEAEALQRRLFRGQPHADLANTLHNRGALLRRRGAKGDLATAAGLFEEALAMQRQVFGGEHDRLARTLAQLALVHRDQGQLARAERELREALAMQQRVLGDRSPEILAETLSFLATVLEGAGQLEQAETQARAGLTLVREKLGPRHPLAVELLGTLGYVSGAQGRGAEAELHYREALVLLERLPGDRRQDTAALLANLASTLQARGKLDEAEDCTRRALTLSLARLGADHPDGALISLRLAKLRLARGDAAEAERLARAALATLRSAYAPESDPVRWATSVLTESERARRPR